MALTTCVRKSLTVRHLSMFVWFAPSHSDVGQPDRSRISQQLVQEVPIQMSRATGPRASMTAPQNDRYRCSCAPLQLERAEIREGRTSLPDSEANKPRFAKCGTLARQAVAGSDPAPAFKGASCFAALHPAKPRPAMRSFRIPAVVWLAAERRNQLLRCRHAPLRSKRLIGDAR
jgi:hypothetical protein